MQQSDHNSGEVYALPVHLLVKSQKEAKKLRAQKEDLQVPNAAEIRHIIWDKLTSWYKN
jgi:hypothetical protein